jgi:hypothetical protein
MGCVVEDVGGGISLLLYSFMIGVGRRFYMTVWNRLTLDGNEALKTSL